MSVKVILKPFVCTIQQKRLLLKSLKDHEISERCLFNFKTIREVSSFSLMENETFFCCSGRLPKVLAQ